MHKSLRQCWRFIILSLFMLGLLTFYTVTFKIPATPMLLLGNALAIAAVSMVIMGVSDRVLRDYYQIDGHKLTSSQVSQYQQAGLSPRDIEFFRHEMAENLQLIENIIAHMAITKASKMMFERLQTKNILQAYFRHIVKYPQEIGEAADFLYRLLPSLDHKLSQYAELTAKPDKISADFLQLQAIRDDIELLAKEVRNSYHNFTKHTELSARGLYVNATSINNVTAATNKAEAEEINNDQ